MQGVKMQDKEENIVDKAIKEAKKDLKKNGIVLNENGIKAFLKDKVKICMIPDPVKDDITINNQSKS